MSCSRKKNTVLVVDDSPENIDLLGGILSRHYHIKVASNGEKALKIAGSENPPDIILLDIMMPGMDGYEVCRRLKSRAKTQDIPVIFVTSMSEVEDETKGLAVGGIDYITKPIRSPIVQARVKSHLELKEAREYLKNQNKILELRVEERTADLNRGHQRERVLNALLRLSMEDISLDEQLERSLDEILSVSWLPVQPQGGIFLVDKDAPSGVGKLELRAQRGLNKVQQVACQRVSFGQCLCGRAAASRELLFADHGDERQ